MLKSKQKPGVGGPGLGVGQQRFRFCCLLLTAYSLLFSVGCRMDMQDQPRYEVYESSKFFKDGLSSRPLVEGTIARGYLHADKELYTGKIDRSQASGATPAASPATSNAQGANANSATNQSGGTTAQGDPNDVETFPFPITAEIVDRGQERYQIFCAMCHGATGYSDGMIVRRGFRKPPSYHTPELRNARVGHFFDVITNGWGAMPSYSAQIPAHDRWAIIAYIRALQLSQQRVTTEGTTATNASAPTPNTGGTK